VPSRRSDRAMSSGMPIAGGDIPVSYDRFRNRVTFPITDLNSSNAPDVCLDVRSGREALMHPLGYAAGKWTWKSWYRNYRRFCYRQRRKSGCVTNRPDATGMAPTYA